MPSHYLYYFHMTSLATQKRTSGLKQYLFSRNCALLEEIMSVALLAQFGVSGVVLCVSAYQVTTVSVDDDMIIKIS